MAGEQKNSQKGLGMSQGTGGFGAPGGAHFEQPAMQFRGPTMINMFCYPGTYSVTTNFGGNVARTFGGNFNPDSSRHVQFSADTRSSGPRNSSARMPRESTPYPSRVQSPNATIVPQAESPTKYFQP